MVEFFTSLMSGHWLAVYAGWIWSTFFVSGTSWAWGLYTAHAASIWWLWAAVLFVAVIILIAYIWIAGAFFYMSWVVAGVVWLLIWAYYLIVKVAIWLVLFLWHLAVWIWPAFLLMIKAFALPVYSAFALAEMLISKNWKWRAAFSIIYCSFFLALFILFPLPWAIWFSAWTWIFFVIALDSKGEIDFLSIN